MEKENNLVQAVLEEENNLVQAILATLFGLFLSDAFIVMVGILYYFIKKFRACKQACKSLLAQGNVVAFHKKLHITKNKLASITADERQEQDKIISSVSQKFEDLEFADQSIGQRFRVLPQEGIPQNKLLDYLGNFDHNDKQVISGKIYIKPSMLAFKKEVAKRKLLLNTMHPHLWKRARCMEADAVKIVLDLYKAPPGSWGMITGGTSQSILTALLAYRNRFYADEKNLGHIPNIIASDRTNPAFSKACEILGIKYIEVPVSSTTFDASFTGIEEAIDDDTILLVANGPAFAEGVMDYIPVIAYIGREHNIPVHGGYSIGGFLLPFAEALGLKVPKFNFEDVKGLTSISLDPDKYGGTEQGISMVLFNSYEKIAQYSLFSNINSSMGTYATFGIEGRKPARFDALITMLAKGKQGYTNDLRSMVYIKDEIVDGIKKIEGIHVPGKPIFPIFAIRANNPEKLDVRLISYYMQKRDWILDNVHATKSLNFSITPAHIHRRNLARDFLNDLGNATFLASKYPQAKIPKVFGIYDMLLNNASEAKLSERVNSQVACLCMESMTSSSPPSKYRNTKQPYETNTKCNNI